MNCQLIRNRILAVPEPTRLPVELATHVKGCAGCRSWYRTFALMDKALCSMPAPESDGRAKATLLKKIRATASEKKPTALEKPAPLEKVPSRDEERAKKIDLLLSPMVNHKPTPLSLDDELPKKKRPSLGHIAARFWPAGVVAATLLVGTVAWLSLRTGNTPVVVQAAPDQMLDDLVKLNVDLAKTEKAKERVPILAQIADNVNQEMRDIALADGTGENMQALQEMYRKVVDSLVGQAKAIDKFDKNQIAMLNSVADKLTQAGQKAEQKAADSPLQSAEPLRSAADVAREGTKRIRTIIKEART